MGEGVIAVTIKDGEVTYRRKLVKLNPHELSHLIVSLEHLLDELKKSHKKMSYELHFKK